MSEIPGIGEARKGMSIDEEKEKERKEQEVIDRVKILPATTRLKMALELQETKEKKD